MKLKPVLAAVAALAVAGAVRAQTTWDMPTPYPDANFHTQNIVKFADEIKDRKSTRLNSSHIQKSRMPSSA